MIDDPYVLLGVPRNASKLAIKRAYKELAMKWHPDKNPGNQEQAIARFQKISNAYSSLMNEKDNKSANAGNIPRPHFRTDTPPPRSQFDDLYDRFYGTQHSTNEYHPGSVPSHHPMFSHKPSRTMSDASKNTFNTRGKLFEDNDSSSDDDEYVTELIGDCVVNVLVTLEEVFTGVRKEYTVTRYRDNEIENKKVIVKLPPGIKFGHKIVLKGQGNKCIGHEPHDIVLIVKEIKHKVFSRKGNDLQMNYVVALKQALLGFDISTTSIDNESITNHVYGPIYEGYQHIIKGYGMPVEEEPGMRGNLLVNISIEYPHVLSEEERENIEKYLPD